tara:strand:+ start:1213 stop:1821 length:609 start_codon:yes stop_codon:yes gene_type:complete
MPDDGTPEPSRKEQILQALATMLEQSPGGRITTARLAAQVGVSEAALYRHFPSKARMFEGLIEFIEETVFTRITRILREEPAVDLRCEATLRLLLTFAERNPGISRILTGDPLVGETERLRVRNAQFFERLETQLKQILREGEFSGIGIRGDVAIAANLLLSVAEGRIHQFVRSDFERSPAVGWPEQWALLRTALFRGALPA